MTGKPRTILLIFVLYCHTQALFLFFFLFSINISTRKEDKYDWGGGRTLVSNQIIKYTLFKCYLSWLILINLFAGGGGGYFLKIPYCRVVARCLTLKIV